MRSVPGTGELLTEQIFCRIADCFPSDKSGKSPTADAVVSK
jgi:hypothetical protein